MRKPAAQRLTILTELRLAAGLTLGHMAHRCGLRGNQSHQTAGAWERGEMIPNDGRRRPHFLGYLWDDLGLRRDPTHFAAVWEILIEEWQWEPLSDREWATLTSRPRPDARPAASERGAPGEQGAAEERTAPEERRAPEERAAPELPPLLPPPLPQKPPVPPLFVGRTQELALYQQQLQTAGVAVIVGMAGVGKTALAATLAATLAGQQPAATPIFWHSFHAQESSMVLFWKLAGFLAHHGQPYLWAMLQRSQQAGGQTPPAEVVVDYLLQTLPAQPALLCLDDWHFVHDEPVLNQWLARLQPHLAGEGLRVLLTSRQTPQLCQAVELAPLRGLSDLETYHFVARHGLHLRDELLSQLYAETEGNGQFLTLAVTALRQAAAPDRFIHELAQARNIERYLLQAVDSQLTSEERELMQGIAILLGHPGSRDLIEAVLDRHGQRRLLLGLVERHLLEQVVVEEEAAYQQHAIVQQFYYELSGRRQRLAFHERAGAYYAEVLADGLLAGQHYLHAEQYPAAAQLLAVQYGVALINQGESAALQRLCAAFDAANLPSPLWAAVQVTQGRIHWLQGDAGAAQTALSAALSLCATCPPSRALLALQAQACRYMAVAVKSADPTAALHWIQQGLRALAASNGATGDGLAGDEAGDEFLTHSPPPAEERALLYILAGNAQTMLGDFSSAQEALESGLALLDSQQSSSAVQREALMTLAKLHGVQGNIARCRAYADEAFALCEEAHDYLGMTILWNQVAYTEYHQGEWQAALASWQSALELAQELGAVHQQLSITLNLGATLKDMGRAAEAEALLTEALLRAHREPGLREFVLYCQCNLAELYLSQGEWADAHTMIDAAQAEAAATNNRLLRPYLASFCARAALAADDPDGALAHALAGCQTAAELGAAVPQGVCQRVYGQVLAALGRTEAALAAYEEALRHVAGYPYEEALTHLHATPTRLALGHVQDGLARLTEAQQIFHRLGAERDHVAAVTLQQTLLPQATIV